MKPHECRDMKTIDVDATVEDRKDKTDPVEAMVGGCATCGCLLIFLAMAAFLVMLLVACWKLIKLIP